MIREVRTRLLFKHLMVGICSAQHEAKLVFVYLIEGTIFRNGNLFAYRMLQIARHISISV